MRLIGAQQGGLAAAPTGPMKAVTFRSIQGEAKYSFSDLFGAVEEAQILDADLGPCRLR